MNGLIICFCIGFHSIANPIDRSRCPRSGTDPEFATGVAIAAGSGCLPSWHCPPARRYSTASLCALKPWHRTFCKWSSVALSINVISIFSLSMASLLWCLSSGPRANDCTSVRNLHAQCKCCWAAARILLSLGAKTRNSQFPRSKVEIFTPILNVQNSTCNSSQLKLKYRCKIFMSLCLYFCLWFLQWTRKDTQVCKLANAAKWNCFQYLFLFWNSLSWTRPLKAEFLNHKKDPRYWFSFIIGIFWWDHFCRV